MKIFSSEQFQRADAYTIAHEPIASIDLMERASAAFVERFVAEIPAHLPVHIVAGMGNNGGDGLAIARLLHQRHYRVQVWVVQGKEAGSPDFQQNLNQLPAEITPVWIREEVQIPEWTTDGVIIDALFGTGLTREVMGLFARVIFAINRAQTLVVSVDMPSGLFSEAPASGPVVQADWVLSFELPKVSFFMPSNAPFVSHWEVLPIGLSPDFIVQEPTLYELIDWAMVSSKLKSRPKFAHKTDFGRVLLLAGSKGMMGAATLSARAAMRSGTGLLTVAVPACGYQIMQTTVPEAMVLADSHEDHIASVPPTDKLTAIGAGPGLGRSTETLAVIKSLLHVKDKPLVLDADALNLIAMVPNLQQQIPSGSILTPHPGEFDRLAGTAADDRDRWRQVREMAIGLGVIVVLKGAHTAIATPEGKMYFNATGNPGMATAGSGDVLTGIITSLVGQGYSAEDAAMIGVFVHGVAGDLAAAQVGVDSLIASDIISHLPEAWQALREAEG